MGNNTTNPTAVIFMRARCLGPDGGDREVEQRLINAQRAACVQAARARGAQVIREYGECGGALRIDKRPVLRLMLDELRALHDADYVIVTSLERLAQKTEDMAAILLELEAAGATLVTADTQRDTQHQAIIGREQITAKIGT